MAKKGVKKGNTKSSTKKNNVEKKINAPKNNTNNKKEDISKKEKLEVKELKEEKIVEKKEEINKESKFDKKILYLIGGVLIIIIVLIFVILKCVNNPKAKTTKSVKEMGKAFYTEYYYKELSNGKSKKELSDILSKFKDKGIKISINNLSLYKSGIYKDRIESMRKDFKCDGKNTKAIIYPKSPYGKNDYKIEIELQCKF